MLRITFWVLLTFAVRTSCSQRASCCFTFLLLFIQFSRYNCAAHFPLYFPDFSRLCPRLRLSAPFLSAFAGFSFRGLPSDVSIILQRVLPPAQLVVGSMCPRVHLSLSAPASSRFPSYPVSFPFGKLVGSSGLEPPTSRLSGVRSNHLSYEPIFQWPSADGFAFPAPAALLLPPRSWWR